MTTAAPASTIAEPARRLTGGDAVSRHAQTRVDWLKIVGALALVLLPCACYWPALNGTFLWDDDVLITKNPLLRSAEGLRQIWFSTAPFDYFPLTNTSFWLEWLLWGQDTLGYHLVNLALHVGLALLLWRLLRILRVPGAWFAALVFAVHPVNVAYVAWISERKNVLSMVFYLGSLICYVRADERRGTSDAWKSYAAAFGWYVLAVLSKSSVVMLPCVLLVLVWWRHGRVRWNDLARTVPFFAVSLAAGLLTIWFQYHRTMTAEHLAQASPLPVRVLNAGRAALVVMTAVAGALCLGCFQRAEEFSDPVHLWRATLAINPRSFAAHNNLGLFFQERSRKYPSQLLLAEHHFREALKIERKLESAGVNLANVLRMEGRWKASADLYRQALDVRPDAEVFNNYGVTLLESGDRAGAREALNNALRLNSAMTNAYYNLYGIELADGHLSAACAMLRACLRIDPDNVQAMLALITLSLESPDQPPLAPSAAEVMVAVAERACSLTRYRSPQPFAVLAKTLFAADRKPEAVAAAARARDAALTDDDSSMVEAIEALQRTLER